MTLWLIVLAILALAAAAAVVWRVRGQATATEPDPGRIGGSASPPAALRDNAGPATAQEPLEEPAGMKLATLGDLAGGLAHEINNPVAIMVEEAGWVADLLEEEEFAQCTNLAELRRAVGQIQTQGGRVREITRNLLSFAHRTAVKLERVDANAVIREAVGLSESRARDAAVAIELQLDDTLPPCRASTSGLQQVIVNLVNNAVDAMPEGGRIEVVTRSEAGMVQIDVADTGQGIPKEILSRIFDPFFTTKPVGKGTGLGLSICYGIVGNMNGTIAVETKPGAGTRFRVCLPTMDAGDRRPQVVSVPEQGDAPGQAIEAVVLLVDDEVAFVDALQRRLLRRGATVLTAHGGTEALDLLQANRAVDVVLLDLRMPGMDGLTALREIKAMRPLVEVLLLSGHATLEAAIEGMKLGAFDYAMKPCDIQHLLPRILAAKRRKDNQEGKILDARIKEITMRRV